ncbi:MAG: PaaI family thioesterase [Syntrophomonadaceae bacterium]|jgi:acyl-coenzyme A thioesterase PaaI-like protein
MTRYTDLESMIAAGIVKGKLDPPCVQVMQRELVEYIPGESLTNAYPVLEMYSNPRKVMQGGFIAAAFDNTFGTYIYYTVNHLRMATIDLNLSFQNPIFVGDTLLVKAYIKKFGKTIVHMVGEAFDSKNKIIATSTTNVMIMDERAKVYIK